MNYPVINLAETGKRIKWLRKRSGYSVSELQEFFGFEHPNAIYKWQKGESLPTVDNLLALSVIFKISMNDILVFDQDFLICWKDILSNKSKHSLRSNYAQLAEWKLLLGSPLARKDCVETQSYVIRFKLAV